MARYYGIEIKDLQTYKEKYYHGHLYLENRYICDWSQNKTGGSVFLMNDGFSFEKLNMLIRNNCPSSSDAPCTLDAFMQTLLNLTLAEKDYKKYTKQGYTTMIAVWPVTGTYKYDQATTAFNGSASEQDIAYAKSFFPTDINTDYRIYYSIDDFNIGKSFSLNDIMKHKNTPAD